MSETEIFNVMVLVTMFILGAVFGSFACCQAWRWRYLVHKNKSLGQWSVCLHCGERIRWYDNIPIISWLVLRGKCRHCHKKIGVSDFLSEISMAVAFMMLSWAYLLPILHNWETLAYKPWQLGLQLAAFILILLMLVVLVILAVYDAKWGELPLVLLLLAVNMGAVILVLKLITTSLDGGEAIPELLDALLGAVILAGPCWLLYKVTHERLMGGGDWILALALAFALADWWLALWTIFLANLLGDLIALPSAMKKKSHVVHFGPFLVMACVIVLVLGNALPLLLKGIF